jgi:transcriptional regulator NrdR family protein
MFRCPCGGRSFVVGTDDYADDEGTYKRIHGCVKCGKRFITGQRFERWLAGPTLNARVLRQAQFTLPVT